MSLSLIKELWLKIKNSSMHIEPSTIPLNEEKEKTNIPYHKHENNFLSSKDYKLIFDYFSQKFPEVREIFSKFNAEDFFLFIEKSDFKEYAINETISEKNSKCDTYLFILYGDIDFFDIKEDTKDTKDRILIKTISAGKVYGHMVKEKYKYNLISRTNISLISINKKSFDDLIININKIKNANKFKFLKKFFPKIRIFSDDIISNVLQYFDRVKFNIHSKIILKDEYNEYVYLLIKGKIGFCIRPKLIFNSEQNLLINNDYIILEQLSKGDLFGINSALKGQKNLYTVITLSNDVEVYRITKGNLLFYFGGNNGILPLNLKVMGDMQDESCIMKMKYLKKCYMDDIGYIKELLVNKKYALIFDENEKLIKNKKIKKNENYFIINEDSIKNNLFEAWKTCEHLGNKISEFKQKLLGGKTTNKKNNTIEEENNMVKLNSSDNLKDFSSIKGDATNRVVSRKLNLGLNMNQIKSLNKLNMYSGAKEKNGEENIKKLADINSKLEGGEKNKLMSFMRNDSNNNKTDELSKENENKDEIINKDKDKDKSEKPKRVKNSLKKLRGLDI